MLTSNEIVKILGERGTGMQQGGLLFYRQRMRSYGNRYSAAQQRLVEQLLEQPSSSPEVHIHPESRVRLMPGSAATAQKPLEAADLEFLRRLPEADKVTFDDAVEVARFARQVPPRSADSRLVSSIWRPIKARHDRLQADAELRNAQQPWPAIPDAAAVTALADSYRAESTELTDEECTQRAARTVNEITAERQSAHQRRIDAARQSLASLDDERRQREALVAADS